MIDGPVEVFGDAGLNVQYFDVSAYRAVFNVSNTPHFSNPNANMTNVTFNADGSIRALNGVGGISSTDRTGRQYDEREWRFGARFGF